MRSTIRWTPVGLTLALAVPAGALAQGDSVAAARQRLSHEPTVAETTRQALRYFRVDPDAFDGLRRAARTRALLPLLAGGYRFDDDQFARAQNQAPTPLDVNESTQTQVHSATVGAVWDLRELVFNPAEVQVYGLIGVQRDLMLEVTRTYYLRRQLMLRLMLRAPEDPLARAALELRIEEFTSILDVLTDGWFSDESQRRARRGR